MPGLLGVPDGPGVEGGKLGRGDGVPKGPGVGLGIVGRGGAAGRGGNGEAGRGAGAAGFATAGFLTALLRAVDFFAVFFLAAFFLAGRRDAFNFFFLRAGAARFAFLPFLTFCPLDLRFFDFAMTNLPVGSSYLWYRNGNGKIPASVPLMRSPRSHSPSLCLPAKP